MTSKRKKKNLFILSSPGHLHHAQGLIKQEGIEHCDLYILFSNRNYSNPYKVKNLVDKTLFESVELLEIPFVPSFGIKFSTAVRFRGSYFEIMDIYKNLFSSYADFDLDSLYLCCYNNHYNLLHGVAKDFGVSLKLYEEGISTYSHGVPWSSQTSRSSVLYSELKRWTRKKMNSIAMYPSRKYKSLKRLFEYFLDIVVPSSCVRKMINKSWGREYLSILDSQKDWDEVWTLIPSLSKKIYRAKKYGKISKSFEINNYTRQEIENHEVLKEIDCESIVFVNQNYPVSTNYHVNIVLDLIQGQMSKFRKAFLKFHPKDNNHTKTSFIGEAQRRGLEISFIGLDGVNLPIESICSYLKPGKVIGIASSSLVYLKLVADSERSIIVENVADAYIEKLRTFGDTRPEIMELLEFHSKRIDYIASFIKKGDGWE